MGRLGDTRFGKRKYGVDVTVVVATHGGSGITVGCHHYADSMGGPVYQWPGYMGGKWLIFLESTY